MGVGRTETLLGEISSSTVTVVRHDDKSLGNNLFK